MLYRKTVSWKNHDDAATGDYQVCHVTISKFQNSQIKIDPPGNAYHNQQGQLSEILVCFFISSITSQPRKTQ